MDNEYHYSRRHNLNLAWWWHPCSVQLTDASSMVMKPISASSTSYMWPTILDPLLHKRKNNYSLVVFPCQFQNEYCHCPMSLSPLLTQRFRILGWSSWGGRGTSTSSRWQSRMPWLLERRLLLLSMSWKPVPQSILLLASFSCTTVHDCLQVWTSYWHQSMLSFSWKPFSNIRNGILILSTSCLIQYYTSSTTQEYLYLA